MQFSAGELASPLVVEAALSVGRSAVQAEWDRHIAVHLLDNSRALAELAVVDTPAHWMDMAWFALVATGWLQNQYGRTIP